LDFLTFEGVTYSTFVHTHTGTYVCISISCAMSAISNILVCLDWRVFKCVPV
jgi:hypothetical protein